MQEYAVIEDEIRKLLLQLSREHQKIHVRVSHFFLPNQKHDTAIVYCRL